jgi:phage I-like protein
MTLRTAALAAAVLSRAAAGRLVRLDAGADKAPPSEFCIWPFGQVDTSKGAFLFDEEAGALVMAAYQDHGVELAFDFEHGMAGEANGQPMPACGWFKLELRKDGLYAVECRWGKLASSFLSDGAYRYFSPYFEYDPETGRIVRLINCALTNTPATKNLQPLVAASEKARARDLRTATVAASMSFDEVRVALERLLSAAYPDGYPWVCDVYDAAVVFGLRGRLFQVAYAVDGDSVTLSGAPVEVHRTYTPIASQEPQTMKTLLAALATVASLAVKPESTEAEAVAALNDLKPRLAKADAAEAEEKELLALTEAKTPAEAKGVLAAWKQAHGQHAALSAELKEAKDKLAAERGRQAGGRGAEPGGAGHEGRQDPARLQGVLAEPGQDQPGHPEGLPQHRPRAGAAGHRARQEALREGGLAPRADRRGEGHGQAPGPDRGGRARDQEGQGRREVGRPPPAPPHPLKRFWLG